MAPGMFMVHKHAARRLHYDLRLEMAGVLLSWAVPKEPSFNPTEKRLAVHVEDHPIEYGTFEGVIPAGQYGAGPTLVWDRGRWIPLDDPEAGLRKGKLRFELDGYKLRGNWSLVRLAKSERDWLLIKEKDAFASSEAAALPETSVLSGLTIEELRDGVPRIAEIRKALDEGQAPQAPLQPERMGLMLAETRDDPFSAEDWLFEIKYDGFRVLAAREHGRARLLYRRGNEVSETYPDVAVALAALPADVILDGEITVCDEQGRPSFQRLQRRALLNRASDIARAALESPATLFVFDLLVFEGRDVRDLPLSRRKQLLSRLLPASPGPIRYADHIEGQGQEMFAQIVRLGLEGMMAKRASSPYRSGRSSDWLKIRRDRSADFVVVGFTAPKGGRSGLGALHLAALGPRDDQRALPGGHRRGSSKEPSQGSFSGDKWVYVGRAGSGLAEGDLATLPQRLRDDVVPEPPCSGPTPHGREHTWVKPRLVCEVRYKEITDEGLLRQPVFLRWRSDKRPEECPYPSSEAPVVPVKAAPKTQSLSNQDKVLWPDSGLTKGDLIAYYREIAPWLLPYLRDRPLVLTRYPEGIAGQSFFQKDAPKWTPEWVRRASIWSEDSHRILDFFVCDEVESLVYLANLAAIPLHVWSSRVGSLERPDYCILDLDPKSAPFRDVIVLAQAIHKLCESIDLPCFAKTSGGSGMHVLIPLGAQITYAQSRSLAELLARVIVQEHSKIATLVRALEQRGDRVYIDYLQNGYGKTIAGPFSARAVPGARVSMPLRWSEVNARLDPTKFTIKTATARMRRLKQDPLAPVLDLRPDLSRALDLLAQKARD
jgi:bifunctional non-homologous end joining protein LigD